MSQISLKTCNKVYEIGITKEDRNIILAVHNELRQKVASDKEYKGNLGPQSKAVRMPMLIRRNT